MLCLPNPKTPKPQNPKAPLCSSNYLILKEEKTKAGDAEENETNVDGVSSQPHLVHLASIFLFVNFKVENSR